MSLTKKLPNDEKITRFWSNWHFFIIWGHFKPKNADFRRFAGDGLSSRSSCDQPKKWIDLKLVLKYSQRMYGKCQKILSHYYEPFESYSWSKSTGAIIAPPHGQ